MSRSPIFQPQVPREEIAPGLYRTFKGSRRDEPALEWSTSTPGIFTDVIIKFLREFPTNSKIRVGEQGSKRYIAVQLRGRQASAPIEYPPRG